MHIRTAVTALFVFGYAGMAQAGHRYFVVEVKGTLEQNDQGSTTKSKVDTTNLLTDPSHFLVAYIDPVPETMECQLEEWRDSNEDGIPDTAVDRNPELIGTQSNIFVRHSMAGLENGRFAATLEAEDTDFDDDGFTDVNGSLWLDGKSKLGSEGEQLGFKGKLAGPIIDGDASNEPSAIFKGSIKSIGMPIPVL